MKVKRLLALLMTLAMIFSLALPVTVFAEDEEDVVVVEEELTEEPVEEPAEETVVEEPVAEEPTEEAPAVEEEATEEADVEEIVLDEEDALWQDGDGDANTWAGTGSESDPYQIATVSDLQLLANNVNAGTGYSGMYFQLTADITLTGDWTPIGNGTASGSGYSDNAFKGTFDGGNHTISNLSVSTNTENAAGLFGVVDGGTVKDLTLTGVSITCTYSGKKSTGAAVGLLVGGGTVSGVTVTSGSVTGQKSTGGVVGMMTVEGTITNCKNTGVNVSGTTNVGGVVGSAYYGKTGGVAMNITGCSNTAAVSGTSHTGGVVGFGAVDVSNCSNSGAVSGTSGSIGGVLGEMTMCGSVTGCTNTGAVTSTGSSSSFGIGGIVGWIRYTNVTTAYPYQALISVTGNSNSGVVSGGGSAGGIVGHVYHYATVSGNTNTASTISSNNFAAGIVGSYQISEQTCNYNGGTYLLTLTDNVSTTTNLSGACTDTFCYDNTSGANVTASNNTTSAPVAQIGDKKYETLAAAVEAANDGDTITLLTDCSGDGIKVAQGKFTTGLTVDFNNHTYTVDGTPVGSTGTETNGFQLLKDNKITFTNGTITGNSRTNTALQRLIQNYSDLTLDKMTLSMTGLYYDQLTMSNCNGTTTISNSTISAPDYTWASITDPSSVGAAALSVGTFSTYTAASVEVTGSSVINGNVNVDPTNNYASANSLTLTSGELNGSIVMLDNAADAVITKASSFEATAPNGYVWTGTDNTQTLAAAVAAVYSGETLVGSYASLDDAYTAAESEQTIKLLADITYGEDREVSVWEKAVNLDLDGHTLTTNSTVSTTLGNNGYKAAAICYSIPAKSAASVTVSNGTIVTAYGAGVYADDPGLTLTLSNLTVNAAQTNVQSTVEYSSAVRITGGAKVIIESGTYSAAHGGYALAVSNSGGEFEINDGTFSGDVFTSTTSTTKTITINGGQFNGTFEKTTGTITIYGGLFTAAAKSSAESAATLGAGKEWASSTDSTYPWAVTTHSTHSYGSAAWSWRIVGDTWSASAKFTCACGDTQTVTADVTSAVDGETTTYTATASFNDKQYTDTKEVTTATTYSVTPASDSDTITGYGAGYFKYGALCTLKTENASDWSVDGVTVAKGTTTYSFIVTKTVVVKAIASTVTGGQEATLFASQAQTSTQYKTRLEGGWTLPEGCTIVSATLYRGLTSSSSGVSKEVLMAKGAKTVISLRTLNATYGATTTGKADRYQNSLVVVVYKDADGTVQTWDSGVMITECPAGSST